MGMWPVSSVVITADKGVTVHKGDELGYFAFGGSDFVMVFQRKSNVLLNGRPGKHVRTGTCIGYAHPNL
ncbi:phosphatidylserine decarboxylase [Mycobacterium sp. 141]|uniref:phosphatidylserine decarboxylase n=1 Tax=Mycobacterium sp. 141 TaxID=1120797 RepID=UPI0003799180|nr:phosphatidylserine decarboxylase [Mycobacterium sp. 141]